MRNTKLFLLASAYTLASATTISEAADKKLACISSRAAEIASAASSCAGTSQSTLHTCISDLTSLSNLQKCFTDAGCPTTAAQWALSHCKEQAEEENNISPDLRRRQPAPLAAMPTPVLPNLVPLFGRAATSEPSPSPCFTETMTSITSCTTNDGGSKSCFPTTSPSAICRPDLICKIDGQGNPSCMNKHSDMTLAGIIIAIVFACALVVSIAGICFFCCKERKEQDRLVKAAEAAKIAKEAKAATAASKRPGKSVTGGVGEIGGGGASQGQPLMYEGGDVGAGSQQGGGYGSAANPFSDR
ncbi:hypothetical protein QBC38DRAFT_478470 [Podospora fimiseda]|uniref:Extracellular membrane protein CFEM domain-containing protein n=1 Tax=Podospora fimiseda TaxID=252190 RepID=A0AAN7BPJ7_9PEZI|nr:hypothetical protein QBC38DRAFT_478470 [Podospora fimiseda]